MQIEVRSWGGTVPQGLSCSRGESQCALRRDHGVVCFVDVVNVWSNPPSVQPERQSQYQTKLTDPSTTPWNNRPPPHHHFTCSSCAMGTVKITMSAAEHSGKPAPNRSPSNVEKTHPCQPWGTSKPETSPKHSMDFKPNTIYTPPRFIPRPTCDVYKPQPPPPTSSTRPFIWKMVWPNAITPTTTSPLPPKDLLISPESQSLPPQCTNQWPTTTATHRSNRGLTLRNAKVFHWGTCNE